jgi:excisionase family DNA binding protein
MMPAYDPTPRRIITVAEIAEYLNVHRNTIYRLVGKGQIPSFRIGIDYRFDRDVIDKWMTDRTSEALKESGAAVRAAPTKNRDGIRGAHPGQPDTTGSTCPQRC